MIYALRGLCSALYPISQLSNLFSGTLKSDVQLAQLRTKLFICYDFGNSQNRTFLKSAIQRAEGKFYLSSSTCIVLQEHSRMNLGSKRPFGKIRKLEWVAENFLLIRI